MFKCLHGQAPLYLTELCRPISSDIGHRHLHSAFTHRLIIPSYGDRSFSVHGPSVWNSLPNNLRLSDMLLETFRFRPFSLDTDYSTTHLLLCANLGYINSIIIIIICSIEYEQRGWNRQDHSSQWEPTKRSVWLSTARVGSTHRDRYQRRWTATVRHLICVSVRRMGLDGRNRNGDRHCNTSTMVEVVWRQKRTKLLALGCLHSLVCEA